MKTTAENPSMEIEAAQAGRRRIPRRTDAKACLIQCEGCKEVRCDRDNGNCPVLSDAIKTLWRYEQAQDSGALVWVREPPGDPHELPMPERMKFFTE